MAFTRVTDPDEACEYYAAGALYHQCHRRTEYTITDARLVGNAATLHHYIKEGGKYYTFYVCVEE